MDELSDAEAMEFISNVLDHRRSGHEVSDLDFIEAAVRASGRRLRGEVAVEPWTPGDRRMDHDGDCGVCGHPGLRPKGHAEWCERIVAMNRNRRR